MINIDEVIALRERNRRLTDLCQKMAELLDGMMRAAAEDTPELMEMPHYVSGMEMFKRLSLELREIQGEG